MNERNYENYNKSNIGSYNGGDRMKGIVNPNFQKEEPESWLGFVKNKITNITGRGGDTSTVKIGGFNRSYDVDENKYPRFDNFTQHESNGSLYKKPDIKYNYGEEEEGEEEENPYYKKKKMA